MKYILILLLSGKMLSCNDAIKNDPGDIVGAPDSTATSPQTGILNPETDVSGCYMKIVGRDTAILMLEQKGSDISGKMLYDNFEKDGSRGTVKGKEEAQIIKLWYDFQSEGMHSTIEVFFKKENGRLLRGVGTMDVKTDTTYFTSGVNYSDKEAFNKVDCGLVKWKFESSN